MNQRSNNTELVVPAITLEGQAVGEFVCYYCHKPTHVIRDCKKRQNRNKRFQLAHAASTNEALDQSVQSTVEELARFHLYQESFKSPSPPINVIVVSGNLNKCLVSSSSFEWVIDFGVTYHMTGNSSLFSTFQSQPSTSIITLADGSQSCVLGSNTIFQQEKRGMAQSTISNGVVTPEQVTCLSTALSRMSRPPKSRHIPIIYFVIRS